MCFTQRNRSHTAAIKLIGAVTLQCHLKEQPYNYMLWTKILGLEDSPRMNLVTFSEEVLSSVFKEYSDLLKNVAGNNTCDWLDERYSATACQCGSAENSKTRDPENASSWSDWACGRGMVGPHLPMHTVEEVEAQLSGAGLFRPWRKKLLLANHV